MAKRVHYWLPENDMERDDAFECDSNGYDLQDCAEDAADDYHSNHDGWDASWPQVFCVERDGKTGRFSVDREARPHFSAYEIREPVGSPSSDAGKSPAKSAANAAITSVKPTGEDGK